MRAVFRGLRAAFVFLTRLPVGGFPYSDEEWAWGPAWFPLVGAMVGLVEASLFIAVRGAGATTAAVVAVASGMMLTGAIHEDGLADTADALGGASDREGVFRILKDSRIGTFGAAALFTSILLRVSLLSHLDTLAPAAIVLARCASRMPPVWLIAGMPYVTPEGARSRPVMRAGAAQASLATLFAAGVAGALVLRGRVCVVGLLVGAVLMGLVSVIAAWRFKVRAGGITGDFMGALQQACEVSVLLGLALAP